MARLTQFSPRCWCLAKRHQQQYSRRPLLEKDDKLVPALGYLDKVNELIEKDRQGRLTNAEFLILQSQDLATLRSYEQAKQLSITLLKDYLVKYKFADWATHQTTLAIKGTPVTTEEKTARAEEIAIKLCNNSLWFSHGRFIGINILATELKLKIEDYSKDDVLRNLIRTYNDSMLQHLRRGNNLVFFHTKNFI